MCDLLLERCPEETEDYATYCSEKDYPSSIDKYCSGGLKITNWAIGFLIMSSTLYFTI